MEGEFKKRFSNGVNYDILTDEIMTVIEEAKKDFPVETVDDKDRKQVLRALIKTEEWFLKWFGDLEK